MCNSQSSVNENRKHKCFVVWALVAVLFPGAAKKHGHKALHYEENINAKWPVSNCQ